MRTSGIHIDQQFFAEFKQGRQRGFRHFANLYYARVFFFAYKALNKDAEAGQAVHHCFNQFWNSRNELLQQSEIKSFLYASAYKQCLEYRRSLDFLNTSHLLMGYNIKDNKDTLLLQMIRSETMHSLCGPAQPNIEEPLRHPVQTGRGNPMFIPGPKTDPAWSTLPGIPVTDPTLPLPGITGQALIQTGLPTAEYVSFLIKGCIAGQLNTVQQKELDEWIHAHYQHAILFDELTDPRHIDYARNFFEQLDINTAVSKLCKGIDFIPIPAVTSIQHFFSGLLGAFS